MVYSRALHLLRTSELDAEFVGTVLKLICGDLKKFRTALHVYDMFEVSRKHVKWREDV